MGEEFRWGIIGPGRIAEKFAETVHKIPGASIQAIASRSAENPDALANSFGAQICYSTYEQLVSDANVDAVYVATPHRYHYENVKLCLEAGKPVLCEKAFTVNASQAEQLFSISHAKGVFLMEALWTRFLPVYEPVRAWISAGEIGDIVHVYSSLGFIAERNADDRLLNKALAGGTVLDLGVYSNAMAQWAMGANPEKVLASAHVGETGVDETINVSYRYTDATTAQFSCTFEFAPQNELVIYGSKGKIIVDAIFVSSISARLVQGKKTKKVKKPFRINGFEYQIEASMQAIRDGQLDCPQMTQADTLANMRALDEIRRQIGVRYSFE